MEDSQFKALAHPVGTHVVSSRGTQVSAGYKPDVTVRSTSGDLTFIIECEQKTDRKAFLGDLLKAEKYAEEQKANPELIIIMQTFGNTTCRQIAEHIKPYAQWLEKLKRGMLNLSAVHVLTDVEYMRALSLNELIGSQAFKKRGSLVPLGSNRPSQTRRKNRARD